MLLTKLYPCIRRVAAVAVLLAAAGAASAQVAPPEPAVAPPSSETPSKGEIKARREFELLDANGDGKLSRSEVKLFPRLAAAFDEADTDHDGYVSYEEVRAFAAKYRAERERKKAAEVAAAAQGAAGPGSAASGAGPRLHRGPQRRE